LKIFYFCPSNLKKQQMPKTENFFAANFFFQNFPRQNEALLKRPLFAKRLAADQVPMLYKPF
jgi:hypothetical protein